MLNNSYGQILAYECIRNDLNPDICEQKEKKEKKGVSVGRLIWEVLDE